MKAIIQKHAGNSANHKGKKVWHTSFDGKTYWSGDWSHRTPKQLLKECASTILDLMKNHPDLF